MAIHTWGEILLTADASSTRVYSPISFTKNVILRAMRFRIVYYGSPTINSINGKIYSDNGSTAPNSLLYTSSDSRLTAELNTNGNGLVETYVLFNYPHLAKDTTYHFVLGLSGYTGTTSSHIAFEKAYPDPIIRRADFTYVDLLRNPYYSYPIFSVL